MEATPLDVPPVRRFRFRLQAEDAISLPAFAGSAWRGLLGHGLRRTVCVTRAKDCGGCLLAEGCFYQRFFESRAGGRARPRPFALRIGPTVGHRLEPGAEIHLGINLFGDHRPALPYLIQALHNAGRRGLGRRPGGRFQPLSLEAETRLGAEDWMPLWESEGQRLQPLPDTTAIVPPAPKTVAVELLTPLRMKVQGRLVGPREFEAGHFLRQLWRRVRELAEAHPGEGAPVLKAPRSRAGSVTAREKDLRWHDWTRYSSRQGELLRMGGLLGTWTLGGEGLRDWWPLLWYGQWLHLGRGTSLGLGRYRLRAAGAEAGTDGKLTGIPERPERN